MVAMSDSTTCVTMEQMEVPHVTMRNVSDGTLLHTLSTACFVGRDDYVQQLLAARADVDQVIIRGNNGTAPLFAACVNGHGNCVQLLLTAHAAIDPPDNKGNTPLIYACTNGHCECVQLLLTAHATIDQAANNGNTPLTISCFNDHHDCVQLLLTAHATIDQADNKGSTPLRAAAASGRLAMVRQLMQAGARVDLPSIALAEANGHATITRLLRSNRRAPIPPATTASPLLVDQRVAVERDAERAADTLLAEEEAEAQGLALSWL